LAERDSRNLRGISLRHAVPPSAYIPLRQASDLNGQLLEDVWLWLLRRLLVGMLCALDKDVAVGVLILFGEDAGLQGVEHIGYVGALQGARSGAGRGPLGRGVKASEGPRWVQVSGSGGHDGFGGVQEGGSVVSCRVLASKPRWIATETEGRARAHLGNVMRNGAAQLAAV
jgi:hypothetical protein